jgi:membrane-associated phospholipid phosphatase
MTRRRPLAAALFATAALAQEPAAATGKIDLPLQIPGLAAGDLTAAWTAPASWTAGIWGRFGLGAAALAGLSLALDRPVDRAVRRSDLTSYDPWARRLDTLGSAGTVAIAGGAYLGGLLADQPKVREFGADAAFSMLVAEVGFTLPAKYLFGRSRPGADAGPYHFQPIHGGDSFPSAHATQAFSLATVISEYADSPWASVAAYGLASLVGLARIEQRAHYVSDVAAGAVIGTLSAKAVMLRHRTLRLGANKRVEFSCTPVWTGNRPGLLIKVRF